MSQIIYKNAPVVAALLDKWDYVATRKKIERLSQEHNLTVVDMPMILHVLTSHSEIRNALRPQWIDTITSEYHGFRDDNRSYEVWHSVGSLATTNGLERAFPKKEVYNFMPIPEEEWNSIGKGSYEGKDIPRIHVEDLKKGNVPKAMPYTIFARIDKDTFHLEPRGPLPYRAFLQDDRVLMVSGSLENRDALAHMLFGEKEEGGEGWHAVENAHRIHDVDFTDIAKGRPLCLGDRNDGFISSELGRVGRFLCMDVHKVCDGASSPEGVPPLEKVLAIINNPDLTREGMVKALVELSGR